MNNGIKILCTIGPTSFREKTIKYFKNNNVDIFRINMSHTSLASLKKNILFFKKLGIKNICIDTEGAQIRTTKTKTIHLKKRNIVYFTKHSTKNKNHFKLYPDFEFQNIKKNCYFQIGFEGLKLKVKNVNKNKIQALVINEGKIESNKGVHFEQHVNLDELTPKDVKAIEIGKKFKINKYALSFANKKKNVLNFRKLIGKNSFLISKIESSEGYKNLDGIIKSSDAILIDRGDLSRYISIEKIPIAQKLIVKKANKMKKDCYIATNLLESMLTNSIPTRAESNDIFSSLEIGAKGLVLAAETAIGKNPIKCVNFINRCISARNNFIRSKKL